MRKVAGRRRVRTTDEGDEPAGALPPAITRIASAKKKSKLSFTNDLEGDDDESGRAAGMGRPSLRQRDDVEEQNVLFPPQSRQPILLDLAKPAYGQAELDALRSETKRQSMSADDVVLAGDELEQMEQDAGDGEGDGGDIPTMEQVRVAREMRERRRKQGDDFIPLGSEAVAPINVDEEDESRIVREKSDDSDEPFEEHRGAIKFGAPVGPDDKAKYAESKSAALDDSVVNDWELELIRHGAGGAVATAVSASEREAALLQESERRKQPRRRVADAVLAQGGGGAIALEDIQRHVQARVREAAERCRIVKEQLNAASVLEAEGVAELPAAKAELAKLSARYDFMQRIREYSLNLISCLEHALPQIEALEKEEPNVGFAATALAAQRVFENVGDEYSLRNVLASFDSFRVQYPQWFFGAHIDDSIAELVIAFVRWELLSWSVFESPEKLADLKWFQSLANFGDVQSPKTEAFFVNVLCQTVVRRVESALARGEAPKSEVERQRLFGVASDLKQLFESKPALLQPLLDRMKQ
jgi:hypothetical protein